jgi:hypothetical protein
MQRSSSGGLRRRKRLTGDRDGPDHPRPRRHPVLAAPRTSPEGCGPHGSHQSVSPELTGRPDTEAGGLFRKAGEEITSRSDLPRSARPARPCHPTEPGPEPMI